MFKGQIAFELSLSTPEMNITHEICGSRNDFGNKFVVQSDVDHCLSMIIVKICLVHKQQAPRDFGIT
jgi:hypothetical protein